MHQPPTPPAPIQDLAVIAAYRFVELTDCETLRDRLLSSAQRARLKGTVLLATEGINFTLAGARADIQGWLAMLLEDPRFDRLELKIHSTDFWPFKRLLVKIKREIIRMNQPTVRPQAGRAAAVDALTLRRWLDQGHCDAGRALVLLDTRNDFEVQAGAFADATHWGLARFSDFPAALARHGHALHDKTVVSYCTGGIRCEKAALWMASSGVPNVLQLDGGILRYLEKCPDTPHWQGDCVVFDDRQALDSQLQAVQGAT